MSKQFTNGFALLVGVNENYVSRWALPDIAKDIAALEQVLTHPERCAYPEDNVKVIAGKTATRQAILDGLEWLAMRIQTDNSGNATATVYYSGHGWRDKATEPPEFYLVPYDVREGQVKSRAVRAVDFREAVGALTPRRLLVVLDCCHAGGMGVKDVVPLPAGYVGTAIPAQLLMAGEEPSAVAGEKGLEALQQGAGRAVLSSSKGEQPSYIRQDRRMSIFTYHLIEALTGHAQPQEGASEVLVSDVMSYVWRHVPRSARADWDKEQEPDYQVSGNFPIALLLGGKGLSKGQPAPDPLEPVAGEEAAKAEPRIDTGGGAHVGGNVHAGRDFVGRDQVRVQITGGVTLGQFQNLLAQVRHELQQARLEPDVAEVVEADVRVIEEQTQKDEPNRTIVLSKLESISQVLKSATGIATASATLAPLVEKAIQWAAQLF